jgi:hypothetical protein
MDVLAFVTELAIGEELTFFRRMIVRARPVLNLGAIREELALDLLFLLISSCLLLCLLLLLDLMMS